jgi:hypothetical protein
VHSAWPGSVPSRFWPAQSSTAARAGDGPTIARASIRHAKNVLARTFALVTILIPLPLITSCCWQSGLRLTRTNRCIPSRHALVRAPTVDSFCFKRGACASATTWGRKDQYKILRSRYLVRIMLCIEHNSCQPHVVFFCLLYCIEVNLPNLNNDFSARPCLAVI